MDLDVRPYAPADGDGWDDLVATAPNGTFHLTRRFLAYHGDRFADRSVVVLDDGRIVGVIPAATDPGRPDRVVSHPGLSYGGIVHARSLQGDGVVSAMTEAARLWRQQGHAVLRYKAQSSVYHRSPAEDDRYALARLGARVYRRDLAAAIDLDGGEALSTNRARNLAKARKAGIELSSDPALLDAYWDVLAGRLAEAHDAAPAHTVEEMRTLAAWFPEAIWLRVGVLDGTVLGGVLVYATPRVHMAQYIASTEEGRRRNVLDLVFDDLVDDARRKGARWFHFGTCTEDEGRTLNAGLYAYKRSFGAGGVVQDHYELDLG